MTATKQPKRSQEAADMKTDLPIETRLQNARTALEISDFGIVLEGGRTRLRDVASAILVDPRVAKLFLGGQLAEVGDAAT